MNFSPFETIADTLTNLLGLSTASQLGAAVNFFIYEFFKVGFLILALSFVIGPLRASLPVDKLRDWLATSRFRVLGYPAAALFGAITPFCSCSSVPLFIGFVEAGIPLGVTFTFLITSPLINEIVVALFLGSFGVEITALYVAAGLILGIAGGLVMHLLKVEHLLSPFALSLRNRTVTGAAPAVEETGGCGCQGGGCCGSKKKPAAQWGGIWGERLRFGARESQEITIKILPYLALALVVGAGIHGYVPENFFAQYFSGGEWWSVPAATLVGLPLYASANGTVPILESLVLKGVPFGTAMAFILAAVGVSLPELILLKRVMTVKLLVIFTSVVSLGVILVGYFFNLLHYVPAAH